MPTFEVERCEVAGDRLEVQGRWYGVRGRRFVRPTLERPGARPLLAVLDHKPWAPRDGEMWTAAFPLDDGQLDLAGASLAVAPDLAVPLDGAADAPREPARRFERKGAVPREASRSEVEALRRERDAARQEAERLRAERDALHVERRTLRAQRDEAAREVEDLRSRADEPLPPRQAVAGPQDAPPPVDWVFRGLALASLVSLLLLVLSLVLAIF